jgi:hypothetical protein
VAETLGDRPQYFQIGNEADLFDRHLRDPKTWSAKAYLEEWLALARAITARVPATKFGKEAEIRSIRKQQRPPAGRRSQMISHRLATKSA